MKILLQTHAIGWFIRLEWVPNDLWSGIFWKITGERLDIWLCIIPCLPIHYASPVSEFESIKPVKPMKKYKGKVYHRIIRAAASDTELTTEHKSK